MKKKLFILATICAMGLGAQQLNASNPNPFITHVTEKSKEVSRTFWLSKEFVETKEDEGQVSYYFDEDVALGNYSFVSYFKDVAYVVTVRDHNYTYTPIEEVDKASVPKKRQVSCVSRNCRVGTCIPMNYGDWGWGCSPCEKVGEPSFCETHVAPDDTWDRIRDWLTNMFGFSFNINI